MKICCIITCCLPSSAYGGTATILNNQAIDLARRNNEIYIISSDILDPKKASKYCSGIERIDRFNVIRFPSILLFPHFSGIFSFDLLKWIVKNHKSFDVFFICYARELLPVLSTQLLELLGCRFVLQTHGMLNRKGGFRSIIDLLFSKRFLRRASRVIVLQEEENRIIHSIYKDTKTTIIQNGLQLSSDIVGWQGLNADSPTILFLARLHPRKRVISFIKAAHILLEKGLKNYQFRIVGPDGGDEKYAKEYVFTSGLNKNIHFLGPLDHEAALVEFAKASLYVLPSENEPFATTVSEALAIGIPVIVTNTAQNLPLYIKYDAVEICDGEVSSIASSIEKLINNEELCKERSRNGKILVENELSISKSVDMLVECFTLK